MSVPDIIAYFGYGSLVNLETIQTPYISASPAKLKGWRRTWLSRPAVDGSFAPFEGLAFLSVEPDPTCEIDGMLVTDHRASLPSLDAREALYSRVEVAAEHVVGEQRDFGGGAYIYVADPGDPAHPAPQILRSYLDAVFQGYFRTFGGSALHRFVDTTANFHYSIREDRNQPVYPRAVALTDEEQMLFDSVAPLQSS